ncbi:MAG: response regulator [Verrucomicrobiota bacterium]
MSASSEKNPSPNRPLLVYVVDDNFALTRMAEIILTGEGFQCHTFCDPAQVVAAFKRGSPHPDLLLTDYEMGSMNGLELIEHCRREKPDLKAILISGTVKPESLLDQPVKVDYFMSKPYLPAELVRAVKSLFTE